MPDTQSASMSSAHQESLRTQLLDLDNFLHSLWAYEPDSRSGDRQLVLVELRQLSIDVERLAFRQSFHCDEGIDLDALDDCRRRTAALAANWSCDTWAGTPWPTELLGERTGVGPS